jgi:glycosyltransferase involved in cell wall biosynthesis
MMMPDTKVVVVTALSPSGTTLAEYGLHFVQAFGRKAGVQVTAFVEALDIEYPELEGVTVHPVWAFGSLFTPFRVSRAARKIGADIVIVNAHFGSFGPTKLSAAVGLFTPMMVRLSGIPVVTLMHNIVETVDLAAAGIRSKKFMQTILRGIGTFLTWIILKSNLVTTTMPRYVEILRSKYKSSNVALTPHGSFGGGHDSASAPESGAVVMTFGKFGTYKKVEVLIDAVRLLNRADLTLVIAGTDSPNTPGYLDSVEKSMGGPDVRFTGYVPEGKVESTFRNATLTVFPYTATTGSSGVLHQAGSFGCPPVLPRLGDLEDLLADEGYTGAYFKPDDVRDLASTIGDLLDNEPERQRIARANLRAAMGLSLDEVVDWYLIHIGSLLYRDPARLLVVPRFPAGD